MSGLLVACTLFEKSYHHGLRGLLNSLFNAGYTGVFYAGYLGLLPDWITNEANFNAEHKELLVGNKILVRFICMGEAGHLSYSKPDFMLQVMSYEKSPVAYFDPDIVVKCEWSYLERCSGYGVSLIEDIQSYLPRSHPKRHMWRSYASSKRLEVVRDIDRYFNSGFVSVGIEEKEFLQLWKTTIEWVSAFNEGAQGLKYGDPLDIFYHCDQDAMNLALMLSQCRICAQEPQAMDFLGYGYVLSHAIGRPKPWESGFLKKALQGYPVSAAIKNYYKFGNGPLSSMSAPLVKLKKMEISLASLISRVWRRS